MSVKNLGTAKNDSGGFLGLESQDHAQIIPQQTRGNVIRSKKVTTTDGQVEPVETEMNGRGQTPEIRVHREGDTIQSIEFICSCGQHATVQIEYDDDK